MRSPTTEDLENVINTYAGNEKFSWLADIARELKETRQERDNLKTVLHGNQDADYDKQLQIETLKSQLAEAEADAKTTIKSEYAFVVCEKCRTAIPPQMLNFKYEFCPACGRKITRKEGK